MSRRIEGLAEAEVRAKGILVEYGLWCLVMVSWVRAVGQEGLLRPGL